MQLHNRQIKATFWKDPELVQWPRDLRWFYEGLIQLADDSGCLEDSPFAFKLELFPSPIDADITIEVLEEWRNQLVMAGKIIPYSSGKKRCLYLSNFQKHQTLKNPQQPDVPLPEWIEWITYESNKKAGKYEIRKDVLSDYLQSSYDVLLREVNRSEFNLIQEKRREEELNQVELALSEMSATDETSESKHSSSFDPRLKKLSELYQTSGMGQVDGTVKEFLLDWMGLYSDEWIENAFREAIIQNKRRASYVNSILQNWTADGGMRITLTASARKEMSDGRTRESTKPSEYGEDVQDAFYRGWNT